ncbi:MAG TPA: hypothetical protein VM555_11090 [Tahibacter sp.]|nr:hypothetical protein [Tahibacter sp.]
MRNPTQHPIVGDIFLDPAGGGSCVLVVARISDGRIDFETYTRHAAAATGSVSYRLDAFVRELSTDLHAAYAAERA